MVLQQIPRDLFDQSSSGGQQVTQEEELVDSAPGGDLVPGLSPTDLEGDSQQGSLAPAPRASPEVSCQEGGRGEAEGADSGRPRPPSAPGEQKAPSLAYDLSSRSFVDVEAEKVVGRVVPETGDVVNAEGTVIGHAELVTRSLSAGRAISAENRAREEPCALSAGDIARVRRAIAETQQDELADTCVPADGQAMYLLLSGESTAIPAPVLVPAGSMALSGGPSAEWSAQQSSSPASVIGPLASTAIRARSAQRSSVPASAPAPGARASSRPASAVSGGAGQALPGPLPRLPTSRPTSGRPVSGGARLTGQRQVSSPTPGQVVTVADSVERSQIPTVDNVHGVFVEGVDLSRAQSGGPPGAAPPRGQLRTANIMYSGVERAEPAEPASVSAGGRRQPSARRARRFGATSPQPDGIIYNVVSLVDGEEEGVLRDTLTSRGGEAPAVPTPSSAAGGTPRHAAYSDAPPMRSTVRFNEMTSEERQDLVTDRKNQEARAESLTRVTGILDSDAAAPRPLLSRKSLPPHLAAYADDLGLTRPPATPNTPGSRPLTTGEQAEGPGANEEEGVDALIPTLEGYSVRPR